MSNENAKLKKYKVAGKKAPVEETLELQPPPNDTRPAQPQQQQPNGLSQAEKTRYKVENLLDFNLKFHSIPLERLYKKSNLPVARFLFRKYLFFIIALTTVWVLYLALDDDKASTKLIGELYQYDARLFANESSSPSDNRRDG